MHPYKKMPDHAYWSRAITRVPVHEVDPVISAPFLLTKETKVATAGSCFAQHIARHLRLADFNYYTTEKLHPMVPQEYSQAYNYEVFSARYGNIYTARQLLQLFDRAYGLFTPEETAWKVTSGSWLDPLRPQIQPEGFSSELELIADRRQHLVAVKKMFETLDVFIFTLGLTESWLSVRDGTVYPICPGVAGGVYSEDRYVFKNFTTHEVVSDFQLFLEKLGKVNPAAKVILTVSPVPLVATAENTHVLNATSYSKAVLRVAAEELAKGNKHVAYFPSYEIITGNFSRGQYFSDDLRSITEAGVNHVMKLFLKHYARAKLNNQNSKLIEDFDQREFQAEISSLAKLNCDEVCYDEFLTNSIDKKG